jgi:hypothetical protein
MESRRIIKALKTPELPSKALRGYGSKPSYAVGFQPEVKP